MFWNSRFLFLSKGVICIAFDAYIVLEVSFVLLINLLFLDWIVY